MATNRRLRTWMLVWIAVLLCLLPVQTIAKKKKPQKPQSAMVSLPGFEKDVITIRQRLQDARGNSNINSETETCRPVFTHDPSLSVRHIEAGVEECWLAQAAHHSNSKDATKLGEAMGQLSALYSDNQNPRLGVAAAIVGLDQDLPVDVKVKLLLAATYNLEALRKHTEAISLLDSYMTSLQPLTPASVPVASKLGSLFHATGKRDNAMELLRQAAAVDPAGVTPELYSAIGVSFLQEGNVEGQRWLTMCIVYSKAVPTNCVWNLAIFEFHQGNVDAASTLASQSFGLEHDGKALNFLGSLYQESSQFTRALAVYDTGLALSEDPVMYAQRGVVLEEMKHIDRALADYSRAVELRSDYGEARAQIARIHIERGMVQEAIAEYEEAIRHVPNFHQAYGNAAKLYFDVGQREKALDYYTKAIAIAPHEQYYLGRGNVKGDMGEQRGSIEDFEAALEINPDYPEALANLARAMQMLPGGSDDAVQIALQTIAKYPNDPYPHAHLGNAYKSLGKLDLAVEAFSNAVRLDPTLTSAFGNMLYLRLYLCLWPPDSDDLAVALRQLVWKELESPEPVTLHPFLAIHIPYARSTYFELAKRFASNLVARVEGSGGTLPPKRKVNKKMLKLGYVSPDFRQHAVAHLVKSIFGFHDRSKFTVYAYSLHPMSEATEQVLDHHVQWESSILSGVDTFRDVSTLSDREIAQMMRDDDIDVLVDLVGWMEYGRPLIFAFRPAPLQITYLGCPMTTGASYIDYYLADTISVPPELAGKHFTEKLMYMPDTYLVTDHKQAHPDMLAPLHPRSYQQGREFHQLGLDTVVYGSFNGNQKTDPVIFSVWMAILAAVPNSRLWLEVRHDNARRNILREAKAVGIAQERISFVPMANNVPNYLSRSKLADVYLDTQFYNAHSVGSDMLWAGLPIVTVPGEQMASRVGASLLTSMGLEDLICHSYRQYFELAVKLGTDPSLRKGVRQRVEQARVTSPLFDTHLWVQNFEKGILTAWDDYMKGRSTDIYV